MAYPELVDWSVTFWGIKGLIVGRCDTKSDPKARNVMKPLPLCLSRLPDSGGIFTLSNGLRMEKISRSVRKVKQAKKKGMTVQSVQSTCHVDCADRTVHTIDLENPEGDTW